MGSPDRIVATTTGHAISKIMMARCPNASEATAAEIVALAATIDRFYASSTGNFTIMFDQDGATLKLPQLAAEADTEPTDAPVVPLHERHFSLEDQGDLEIDGTPDETPETAYDTHTVGGDFTSMQSISFTDEIVVVHGHVRWQKQIERV